MCECHALESITDFCEECIAIGFAEQELPEVSTKTTYIKTISYSGFSIEIFEISSEDPGINGYLTVGNVPFELGLFSDEDEILETIQKMEPGLLAIK